MKFIITLSFLVVLVFNSCTDSAPVSQDTGDAITEIPEDFESFYVRFHEDSVFQLERIDFPLKGVPASYNPDSVDLLLYRWFKEDWVLHKNIVLEGTGFRRERSYENGVVEEAILHVQYKYAMVRRFEKQDGEWTLVYYSGMNPY